MRIVYESRPHGFLVMADALSPLALDGIVAVIREHAKRYTFVHPHMRGGTALSVRVTSFGDWGWWAGPLGYRYVPKHPATGEPWPSIPETLKAAVRTYVDESNHPRHHDSPIFTISLGASAIFEIKLSRKISRLTLRSGDMVVMAGPSRSAEHRVVRLLTPAEAAVASQDDLFGGTQPLPPAHDPLGNGTRMSLTWRRTGLKKDRPTCA